MSHHHSDQMSQRSQVSRVALCMSNVKVLSVTQWLSDSVSDKVTCSGQQKSTQSTFIKTCEDLTAFYLFLITDMTLFPNWSLPGRVKFSWKGELYFWLLLISWKSCWDSSASSDCQIVRRSTTYFGKREKTLLQSRTHSRSGEKRKVARFLIRKYFTKVGQG